MRQRHFTSASFLLGCALAAALVLASSSRVTAACPPESNGYVYLHPVVVGKNWSQAFEFTDLFLSSTVCALKPQAFSISSATNSNVAVFSVAGGGIWISQVDDACPTGACYKCFVDFLDPASLNIASLPPASGSPIHVIRQTGFTYDNVKFAVAGTNSRIFVVTAPATGASITRVDTLTLSGTGNQAVRFLGGALNQTTGQDTGLWVAGTRGLLRFFPYKGTAWGAQRSYDVAATDTVLCVGGGFAGGFSGRIYAWNGTQFAQGTRPTQSAVRSVSAQAACGDSGLFLLREGNVWTVFRAPTGSYRHFNLTQTRDGSTVELLDERWVRSQFVYRNSITEIVSTNPSSVLDSVRSALPYVVSTPATSKITLNLDDPDSNYQVPQIRILRTNRSVDSFPLVMDTRTLQAARPNASCSEGLLLLTGKSLVVNNMSAYSVTVEAEARLGTIDALCGECTWVQKTFRVSRSWNRGDTLRIRYSFDSLRIVNDFSSTTSLQGSVGGTRADFCIGQARILLPGPGTIRIHDAAGRLIAQSDITHGHTPSISTSALPRGILYIRHESLNGKQRLLAVVPNIK